MKIKIEQYYLITIDRIYKHRKENVDGLKKIIKEKANQDMVVMGVDGNELTETKIDVFKRIGILHQNLKIPNYNRNLAKSEIGLILSQYQIFTHMVKNNIQYAIIFEDDAKINKTDFFDDLDHILQDCPKDFVFISLFHHFLSTQKKLIRSLKKYNKYILHSKGHLYGTVCFIISLKGAKLFLKNIFPTNMPVDTALWRYCDMNGGRYISNKQLVCLSDNISFIERDRWNKN